MAEDSIADQAALPGLPLMEPKLNSDGTHSQYSERLIEEALAAGRLENSWVVETGPSDSDFGPPRHIYERMFKFDKSQYVRLYDTKDGNARYIFWGVMWHATRSRAGLPPHPAAVGIWNELKRKHEEAMRAEVLRDQQEGEAEANQEDNREDAQQEVARRGHGRPRGAAAPSGSTRPPIGGGQAREGRCARCLRQKKGCDRARPCGRCFQLGVPDQCVDEDASSASSSDRAPGDNQPRDDGDQETQESRTDHDDTADDGEDKDNQPPPSGARRSGRATAPTHRYASEARIQDEGFQAGGESAQRSEGEDVVVPRGRRAQRVPSMLQSTQQPDEGVATPQALQGSGDASQTTPTRDASRAPSVSTTSGTDSKRGRVKKLKKSEVRARLSNFPRRGEPGYRSPSPPPGAGAAGLVTL